MVNKENNYKECVLKNILQKNIIQVTHYPLIIIKILFNVLRGTSCYEIPAAQPLSYIINFSLKNSQIPSEWKHALITPIFKSGTADDNNNYRPISILPALSKILEICVHQQLMSYLVINNTNNYKYLASVIDSKLHLTEKFNKQYRKASGRLRLLNALRPQIDDQTATTIYNTQ